MSCKSCWWQEGGKCYVDSSKKDSNGYSTVLAEKLCEKYWNKRKALTTVIPHDILVITSEKQND